MSRFKKYEKYKNSEILWTPIIPEHWDILPNKTFLTQEKKTVGTISKNYNLLSLTKNGVIIRDLSQMKGKFPAEFNSYKIVFPNRLILCLFDMDETPRTVGLSNNTGMITRAYDVLKINNINEKYIYYYYLHLDNSKDLKPLYRGLRKTIKIGTFLSQKMPVPPIEEQNKIVNFITHKEKQINKLIRKQKRLIELLQEKKKVIITEAVTKGLDKNAPMKDSGIEWIGKIPNNWNVIKFKFLADIKNGGDYKDVEVASGGYPVMGSGGEFARASKYLYNKPSILLGRKGTIGKPIYMDEPFWCVDTMFYSEVSKNVYPKFLFYASHLIRYEYYQTSTALPSMTQRDIGNEFIRIPDYNNQILISNYLDKKCKNFNDIIDNKEAIITKLEEYKKSLIASAVTGQIDIRDYEIKDIIEDDTIEHVEEENNLSESEVEYANC